MGFETILQSLLAGFPYLFLHFSVTTAIWVLGVVVYMYVTPYNELELIRGGNVAAAVSLAGAMIGLSFPLAFALAGSVNVADIAIWGGVTIVLQIAVFRIIDLLMQGLSKRIEADEIGPAILVSGAKVSIAALNAAAVAG